MLGRTASQLLLTHSQASSPPSNSKHIKYLLLSPRSNNSPLCQFQTVFTPNDTFIQTPLIEAVPLLSCIQAE
jgi:hypothetical protein